MTPGVTAAALKTEIETDPKGLGYGTWVSPTGALLKDGWPDGIAALLNQTTGPGIGQLPNNPILSATFLAAVDPNELGLLTTLQLDQLSAYLSAGTIPIGSANVQAWINKLFPAATAPNTSGALVPQFNRVATRAEMLFGSGVVIQSTDVSTAITG